MTTATLRHSGSDGAYGSKLSRSTALNALSFTPGDAFSRRVDDPSLTFVQDGFFLKVKVSKVTNLGQGDRLMMIPTSAPDPYVRIAMITGANSNIVAEFSTRVVFRNRNPLFEESFLIPLKGLTLDENTRLIATVHDYDSIKDKFMGQMEWRLSMLLSAIKMAGVPHTDRWVVDHTFEQAYRMQFSCALMGRRGEHVPGELMLVTEVIEPEAGQQESQERPPYTPAVLQNKYGSKTFMLTLLGVHGLRTLTGPEEVKAALKDLTCELRVGENVLRVPLTAQQMIVDNPSSLQATLQLQLDEKIVMPLKDAFNIPTLAVNLGLNKKPLQELGDVRVYILAGNNQLCKAQIPLWEVPHRATSNGGASPTPKSVPPTPKSVPATPKSAPSTPGGGSQGGKAGSGSGTVPPPAECAWKTEGSLNEELSPKFIPMERYSRNLVHPVSLEYVACLVDAACPASGPVGSLGDEDEEDVASAVPLPADQIPAPLAVSVVAGEVLPCGPCRLYQLLVDSKSSMMKKVFEQEGLSEVDIPGWSADAQRTRTVSYVKPINVPFGPKSAKVQEAQTLLAKAAGGWVLECKVTTSAPKGDCFVVVVQIVAQRGDQPNTCTLRVTSFVDFVKSAGMLKGIIEKGAGSDLASHWALVVKSVREAVAAGGAPGSPAADATHVAAMAISAGTTGVPGAGTLPVSPALLVYAFGGAVVFLLLLVLLLLWRTSSLKSHLSVVNQDLQALRELQASTLSTAKELAITVAKLASSTAGSSSDTQACSAAGGGGPSN